MGRKIKFIFLSFFIFSICLIGIYFLYSNNIYINSPNIADDNFHHFQGEVLTISIPKENPINPSSISVVQTQNVPWGSVQAYEFKPGGLRFRNPAKIEIDASKLTLPPGTKRKSLRLAYLENGRWKIIEGSSVDPLTGKLAAEIGHFSLYGVVSEPEMVSDRGTHFEANGVVADTDASVYGRMLISSMLATFYAEKDEEEDVNLTLSGLPTDGEHHVYVNSYDEHYLLTPSDGGVISVALDLTTYPALVWMQPVEGTITIGGGPDVDQCETYGTRVDDVCTLTTNIENNIRLLSGTLDCDEHSITLPAAQQGMGFGIYIPATGEDGIVVENCTIGSTDGGFGNGIQAVGKDTLVVNNNVLVDNTVTGIVVQNSTNSYVTENEITGGSYWAITVLDSSSGNEVTNNSIDVDFDAILIEGLDGEPLSATENRILDNIVTRATGGILLSSANDNLITGNDISGVLTAVGIWPGGWPNTVYWNNFSSWSHWAVWANTGPAEISDGTAYGNWWGYSCPGPLFTPGVDSNRVDVTDSFAYGQQDAWDMGLSPGCITGDMDGDTVPDAEDNCPEVWNPGQENVDGFGEGDACDETPPDPPVITSPVDGSVIATQTPIFEGMAELRSLVKLTTCVQKAVEGGTIQECDVIAEGYATDEGSFFLIPAEPIQDGYYSFYVNSIDAAGNISLPSNTVAITIDTHYPDAPIIFYPVANEVITTSFPIIGGIAESSTSVYVFDYGILIGSGLADDFGYFDIQPDEPLPSGDHSVVAIAVDEANNQSQESTAVIFSIQTVSSEDPIEGVRGKSRITFLNDSPDPFDPQVENSTLLVEYNTDRLLRLRRANRWHEFRAIATWKILSSETGETVKTVENEITKRGGFLRRWQRLEGEITGEWNGKNEIDEFVSLGGAYSYDISVDLVRVYIGPGRGPRRCLRGEEKVEIPGIDSLVCLIDNISVPLAGTIGMENDRFKYYKSLRPFSICLHTSEEISYFVINELPFVNRPKLDVPPECIEMFDMKLSDKSFWDLIDRGFDVRPFIMPEHIPEGEDWIEDEYEGVKAPCDPPPEPRDFFCQFDDSGGLPCDLSIREKLERIEDDFPISLDIGKYTKLIQLETSYEGRPIYGVVVGKVYTNYDKPLIVVVGTQHAREWVTTELVMQLMYYYANALKDDKDGIRDILSNRAILFIPVANPDGYQYTFSVYRFWRKNRTPYYGEYGVDVNRNFNYMWNYQPGCSRNPSYDTYAGDSAASEAEVHAIINGIYEMHTEDPDLLFNSFAVVNYHAYGNLGVIVDGTKEDTACKTDSNCYPADFTYFRKLAGDRINIYIGDPITADEIVPFPIDPTYRIAYPVSGDLNLYAVNEEPPIINKTKMFSITPEISNSVHKFEFECDTNALNLLKWMIPVHSNWINNLLDVSEEIISEDFARNRVFASLTIQREYRNHPVMLVSVFHDEMEVYYQFPPDPAIEPLELLPLREGIYSKLWYLDKVVPWNWPGIVVLHPTQYDTVPIAIEGGEGVDFCDPERFVEHVGFEFVDDSEGCHWDLDYVPPEGSTLIKKKVNLDGIINGYDCCYDCYYMYSYKMIFKYYTGMPVSQVTVAASTDEFIDDVRLLRGYPIAYGPFNTAKEVRGLYAGEHIRTEIINLTDFDNSNNVQIRFHVGYADNPANPDPFNIYDDVIICNLKKDE